MALFGSLNPPLPAEDPISGQPTMPPTIMERLREALVGGLSPQAAASAIGGFDPAPVVGYGKRVAENLAGWAGTPGEMAQRGYAGDVPTVEEMVPWSAGTALSMLGGSGQGTLGIGMAGKPPTKAMIERIAQRAEQRSALGRAPIEDIAVPTQPSLGTPELPAGRAHNLPPEVLPAEPVVPPAPSYTPAPGIPTTEAHPFRIAQRLPTNVGAVDKPLQHIDMAAMQLDPKSFEKNVDLVKDYPNMRPEDVGATHAETATNFKEHLKDNLRWLIGEYGKLHPDLPQMTSRWYDGGNAIVRGRAAQFGLPDQAVAGVYAAMSPQKDWYQNVGLGDRLLHIYHNNMDTPFSPEMKSKLEEIYPGEKFQGLRNILEGRSLRQLNSPQSRAAWIRLYDEAHHGRDFHIVSPEGELGDVVTSKSGEPSGIGWGSTSEIAKAVNSIQAAQSPGKMSKFMGTRHKVRNFYNNLLDPNNPHGDVTIDTHAVAAALLRPLSGNSLEVAHNFRNYAGKGKPGAAGSTVTGAQGLYPIYADAYRELANEMGLLPRQVQSIGWEAVRGLFPENFKTAKNVAAINSIWQDYRNGVISADQARSRVHERANGIEKPSWWKGK